MSTFLDKIDYEVAIGTEQLDSLTQGVDGLLDPCEDQAIELMRGYLSSRYDVDEIFLATGTDRNPIIVKYAVDISLYYLYSRLQPNAFPELRQINYDTAETWLRRVSKQEVNPPDLPLVIDGTKDYVLYGSNPKRTNHLI